MSLVIQPYETVQGDYGQQFNFTIVDGQGNPVDLTGSTLTLKVQAANDATNTDLTLSGNPIVVDNATAGQCHYLVVNGDFPNPGKYNAQIVMVVSGISQVTAPGITIVVYPSLPQANN